MIIINLIPTKELQNESNKIYRMQLRMAKNTLWVEDKEVKLQPGMAVTAEVQTGERRIIEFSLSPLLRYKDESIRER
jgi:hemolysin D